MTPRELLARWSKEFGFKHPWPKTYEVDAATYGRVCQEVLHHELANQFPDTIADMFHLKIAVGSNNGIMYKNIELLIKEDK